MNVTPAILGGIFMATSMGLLHAGELTPGEPEPQVQEQLRDSVNRLQTFDSDVDRGKMYGDADRDREIARMLPNFRVVREGSSDRNLKDQAIARLERTRLTQSGRQTAEQMVDKMSLFRRLPEVRFEMDPVAYDYFIGNPDVVVGLWQTLGISAIELRPAGKYQFQMNNVDGTNSKVFFLKRSQTSNIVYCEGEFQSPFLKNPITANGLICINARFEKDKDGTTFVRHSADVFVAFPNLAIEAAAKMISPVSNYIADRNFQEISLFMHSMSLSMARQPRWVQELAGKLQGVMPEQAAELNEVTLKVYENDQARLARRWEEFEEPIQLK